MSAEAPEQIELYYAYSLRDCKQLSVTERAT